MSDTSALLVLNNLTVSRGDFVLCAGVSMSLKAGEICHLIGANGTGKTTLLMQLAGLLPISHIESQGIRHLNDDASLIDIRHGNTDTHDSARYNQYVAYLGQPGLPTQPLYVSHQLGIHPSLSVAQNLSFLLNLYGVTPSAQDLQSALAWVGLAGFETVSCLELSAGQTRRVHVARLKLMQPMHTPLWLLDEPFTALDVQMVDKLERQLQNFTQAGGAVLMTSHQTVSVATKTLDLSIFLPGGHALDDEQGAGEDDIAAF